MCGFVCYLQVDDMILLLYFLSNISFIASFF